MRQRNVLAGLLGISLAAAAAVAAFALYDGLVEVGSARGQGTTVTVRLPASRERAT